MALTTWPASLSSTDVCRVEGVVFDRHLSIKTSRGHGCGCCRTPDHRRCPRWVGYAGTALLSLLLSCCGIAARFAFAGQSVCVLITAHCVVVHEPAEAVVALQEAFEAEPRLQQCVVLLRMLGSQLHAESGNPRGAGFFANSSGKARPRLQRSPWTSTRGVGDPRRRHLQSSWVRRTPCPPQLSAMQPCSGGSIIPPRAKAGPWLGDC